MSLDLNIAVINIAMNMAQGLILVKDLCIYMSCQPEPTETHVYAHTHVFD